MEEKKGQSLSVNVLISCMHQKDTSIIGRTNIQTDAIVVNQCDEDSVREFDFTNKAGRTCHAKIINTTERGLSRSRNMAIANAWGDVCLICDDDEVLDDDYENKIQEAFNKILDSDVITFIVDYKNHHFPEKMKELGVVGICRTFSVQVCFKCEAIANNHIIFDEKMGSGSGNGAGEENKFLMDCYRKNMKLYFYPAHIGKVLTTNSLWNHGLTEKYFRDRGWSMRRSFGFVFGYLFLWYNALHHKNTFTKEGMTICRVLKNLHGGFFETR